MNAERTPPAPPTRRMDRRLQPIYFRVTGIHDFLTCRCRPAGIALALMLMISFCLGVGHNQSSIYQLFSLCLGISLICLPWALTRKALLTATRELPRFATAGEKLCYVVRAEYQGKGRLSHAWLADYPPDPRPSLQDFLTLREPGEEERNGFDRHFAYFRWQWLMRKKRRFTGGFSHEELEIQSGQEARVVIEITPSRRGMIRLDDLRLLLPDPLGLFQSYRKIVAPAATLTVLPRRFPLPAIKLPGETSFEAPGDIHAASIGNSGEFVALRDYRPGDPLRQIHWKSWARNGRPIVKEMENSCFPRYGLILDTLSGEQTDPQFEEAISVAASFAAASDDGELLLDRLFIKNEVYLTKSGQGLDPGDRLLEVLAEVSPERSFDFAHLARLILRHRDELTCCLVILNGWDESRADFLRALKENKVPCVPLIIGIGPPPVGLPGHWLESGQIARDLQRLPASLRISS